MYLQVLPGFIENQHGTIIFTGAPLAYARLRRHSSLRTVAYVTCVNTLLDCLISYR